MLKYRHLHEKSFKGLLLLLLVVASFNTLAQKMSLEFYGLNDLIKPKIKQADSAVLSIIEIDVLNDLRAKGYWQAQLDSVGIDDSFARFYFSVGKEFDHVAINMVEPSILGKSYKKKNSSKNIEIVEENIDFILDQYQNNGYPFVKANIDSVQWNEDVLHLKLGIVPGLPIKFDSVIVEPAGILSQKFLSQYLGISVGQSYTEKLIHDIPKRMNNLPFVKLTDVDVTYQYQMAQVQIGIEKRKVNYFDGILGMVPDQDQEGVEFTGELNLSVQNLFKSAKAIEIHWQRLRPESQKLQAIYTHSQLLGTPINLRLAFDQLRQDSTFSNRSLSIGFEYYIKPNLKMVLDYENKLGNELSAVLENTGDFEIDYYGLGMFYEEFDDKFNPRKGFSASAEFGIGTKKIAETNTSGTKSTQYDIELGFHWLYKIGKRYVFSVKADAAKLINNNLFLNDLYRLGGLRTLRGFNEGDFFSSEHVITQIESRLYVDNQSYLVAFYDQGFLRTETIFDNIIDRPIGIGAGMVVSTKNGNFQILYGLGRRVGQPFSFDSSKIHFGYTALF